MISLRRRRVTENINPRLGLGNLDIRRHAESRGLVSFCSPACEERAAQGDSVLALSASGHVSASSLSRLLTWLELQKGILSEIQYSTLFLLARLVAEITRQPTGDTAQAITSLAWNELQSSYVFPGERFPTIYHALLDLIPGASQCPFARVEHLLRIP